jgi:hypothetical protein
MKKALVYIPIVEALKELEDGGLTKQMTGKEIRERVIKKVIAAEGLNEDNEHAVGFACNDLVRDKFITPSAEGFKLARYKIRELFVDYT